ncbi:hypothetical protein [Novosphingobium huizhouense]|uniref:hypothetical protein n=1 Tax=Novosphingobium huizhouense TaxID=2866625 RepID=UPI001CD9059A|nr:hypothetical protein [Novosphingobium huizhouense]
MIARARAVAMGCLLLAAAIPAAAPAQSPASASLETFVAEGSVGPYRAGLNLTIRDRREVVAAHYYYASTGKDIPLKIVQVGETLVLDEPDGARMALALTNADPKEPRPLNFATATGLAGQWTSGAKALPARFGFGTVLQGPSPARWYGDVTRESDAAFEARVRRFLNAVRKGDCKVLAGTMSYPLTINGRTRVTVRLAAAFSPYCRQVLAPASVARLREAIPHEMFVRDGQAMVANGTAWFDANGAKALNLP